ncbi:MAG: hypothetical protein JSW20_06885 [Nitrospiraceae bacterium]|nr:MAG: hypothetical protein JSW20_06885 [Nitrospiraceae bacterium]
MMKLKHTALLLLILVFIISCSSNSGNVHKPATGAGTESKTTHVSIGPENATKASIISLEKNDILTGTVTIQWMVNGIREESAEGLRFVPKDLSKGDLVQALVISGKNEYLSNELTIRNSPPVIDRAKLIPEFATSESTFQVQANARDLDNDSVFFQYKWFLNGNYESDDSFLDTDLKRGDMVSVEVFPSDGEDTGKSVTLNRKVLNALPRVADSDPILSGQTYTYRPDVTDPDGDTLSFQLRKGPDGMNIDPVSGAISWEFSTEDKGYHDVEIAVNDNHGGEILFPFTAVIGFQ